MYEDGEFHDNMMRHLKENQRREDERYYSQKKSFWNYGRNNRGSSINKSSKSGIGLIIILLIGIFLLERYRAIVITILIIITIVVLFSLVKKFKASSGPLTTTFLGKDTNGRSVYEVKKSNGITSMWKLMEDGTIVMDIKDFHSSYGKSSFRPSENTRRYYIALEKGLVQAKDKDGNFEKNNEGFIRFKDSEGNYVDNPNEYYP